jgi:predicted alpha/beta-fold hydrolase
MTVKSRNNYRAPFWLPGGHLQTIYPSLFRNPDFSFYKRERINTPDEDFLDLDWSSVQSNKLAVISHGLEGSSFRPYVVGMARALNRLGWDALAWNFRSCSGVINRQLRFYHSGASEDLDCIIRHAVKTKEYSEIALIGFSMGGNLSLVYLGRKGNDLSKKISKAVVFSVPGDLKSSSLKLAKTTNKIYMRRFLKSLHLKVKAKMKLFPGEIDDHNYDQIKNFRDFDDRYTAPIHGFKNAEDYWTKCSSNQFIEKIQIPTLIVNAVNDPFLDPAYFPYAESEDNKFIKFEITNAGGHVGFVSFRNQGMYWSEIRAGNFLNNSY